MNNTIKSLGIILTSSLLLAGCTFPGSSKPQPQTTSQMVNESAEFGNAIKSGKPTICTMTKGADVMEYSIKGKKMRIKSTTTLVDDKGTSNTKTSHMINDEKYFYTWDDATKQGTKMSLTLPSATPQSSISTQEIAPKFDSESDYDNLKNEGYTIDCKTATIDDSVFTPPSDIKFTDPSELMRQIPSPAANGKIDLKQLEELKKQYGGE